MTLNWYQVFGFNVLTTNIVLDCWTIACHSPKPSLSCSTTYEVIVLWPSCSGGFHFSLTDVGVTLEATGLDGGIGGPEMQTCRIMVDGILYQSWPCTIVICIPSIYRSMLVLSSPSSFVSIHTYSPSSVYCKSDISNTDDVAQELIFSLSLLTIVLPFLLHSTSGSGNPLKAQLIGILSYRYCAKSFNNTVTLGAAIKMRN